jgi:hypothetical protein
MTDSSSTRRPQGSSTTRALAAVGLVALLGGISVIALSSREGSGVQSTPVGATATAAGATAKPKPAPTKPKSVRIAVTGVGAYDPEGDKSENDSMARLATDGSLATAWKSERYQRSFFKSGVGLVVDAGRPVKANRVVVATDTPGYSADIRVGSSPGGPFVVVSKEKRTTARTTFVLAPRSGRYLMVWITSMPDGGAAAVNEITVTAAG